MKHRKEILAIALPAIVSNITTPILGLVDVAIAGHIGSAVYLAAIALGGTVFNMLYWLFNFLRMGTSGLTAQAYGSDDRDRCGLVFYRSLIVAVAVAVLILALSHPLGSAVIDFMDAGDSERRLAMRYVFICIWGAPAVMITYALSGWFLGMQDSRTPMWMAVTTNLVNIAVSFILVFGLGWKIEGVATGTAVAQWAGAILGLVRAFHFYRPVRPGWSRVLRLSGLLGFFRINADIFLRTACLVAVTLWFTHAGALAGVDILAANALLLQLFMLFSFFIDGFAFSAEALAGKYCGRGDRASLRSLLRSLLLVGLGCAVMFSLVYFVGGEGIIGLLAEDPSVVVVARDYLPWAVAVPFCGFCAFVLDGFFVGLTRTRAMLASMGAAMAIFFLVWYFTSPCFGNDALWLAFDLYLLTRGLISLFITRKYL